jgi:hypothetical protein
VEHHLNYYKNMVLFITDVVFRIWQFCRFFFCENVSS